MKIVLFHPVLLPPKNYGGVERVVLWLAQGLKDRGHQVWIAALDGSRLPPGLSFIPMFKGETSERDLLARLPAGVDVVHFMAPPDPEIFKQLPCAGLLTVHGNGKPGETFPLNTVFLSRNHAERHGAEVFVYNGIDPADYQLGPALEKRAGYLFLSKTSWRVKNVAGAIRLCAQAGVNLNIAGGHRPWLSHFEVLLRPGMKWLGPVTGMQKAQLLAQASALLFPVTWPEPFGLVVVEALISGTPVFASRKGSLPELVPPAVGMLLDTPEDWVEALSNQRAWDPELCRTWAIEHFHYSQMAEGYEALYKRVIQGETIQSRYPIAGDWRIQ